MTSYPCLQDLFACGPSKIGFDAPDGGQVVYWSATFDVVARVFRVGELDSASSFFFKVLDKRNLSDDSKTIDGEPQKWEWRDENGNSCEEPVGAIQPRLATERDYYDRILAGLRRVEQSFFDSFNEAWDGKPSQYYSVREKCWKSDFAVIAE